jgi:hypothetical protein
MGTTQRSNAKRPITLHLQDLTTKFRMILAQVNSRTSSSATWATSFALSMCPGSTKVQISPTAYDATERFKDDNNKFQGQLQEIIGLLKEQLSQETILSQKWVRREVRDFISSD